MPQNFLRIIRRISLASSLRISQLVIAVMGAIIGQPRGPQARELPGFQTSAKSGPFITAPLARFVALVALVWAI
jgi:hypothetical protein